MRSPYISESQLREYLDEFEPSTVSLIVQMKSCIEQYLPDHEQDLRWKSMVFDKPGATTTVKDCVCAFTPIKKQVRLSFPLGVFLNDPSGILQGNLRYKRFVFIRDPEAFDREEIRSIVLESYHFKSDRVLYKLLPNVEYRDLASRI